MKKIMDAQLIEQLDRRRYKYLLWQTVGFALFFPGIFILPEISGRVATTILAIVSVLGAGLFIAASLKNSANERKIKADLELKAALNNEMVVLYAYKSQRLAIFAAVIVATVLMFISRQVPELTARFACMIIVYAIGLVAMISKLIYNRQ